MIATLMLVCMLLSTVVYASTVGYSFSGWKNSTTTNTFQLAKGPVLISGTQKTSQPIPIKYTAPTVTFKYELYEFKTQKKCGSITISGSSFKDKKIGNITTPGRYYLKVSTNVNDVLFSGKGTLRQ
jgi:hypothetical protein